MIGYIQQRPLFVGWARGTVVLPGTALWVGADGHSAINGERSALFWALAWSLQFGSNLPCRVFVDSLVALRQTSGVYGSAAASTFAHACRALAQAVDSLGGVSSVCFHHVRAHKGHPFNELADLLAGSYALPDAQIPADVARLSDWVQAECIDWLWLYIAATRDPHCWPALQQRSFIDHAQRTVPQVGGAQSTAFFYRQVPASNTLDCPSRLRFCMRLVTANVQTLEDGERREVPGRTFYVRSQLDSCGATVTGLQETRARETGTLASDTHLRYFAARDLKGTGGVELWFSRTTPFAWDGDSPLYFHPSDFRALAWNERYLIVRFVRQSVRITFAVIHALAAAHPDRDKWWAAFGAKLHACAQDDEVVILGDWNTRFAEPLEGRIGDLVWQSPQPVPSAVFDILSRHDLWVPSTFSAVHTGASHTWVAPGGNATARIDYVVVPERWFAYPASSWVLYDVDFGQTGLDHYAAAVDIQFVRTAAVSRSDSSPNIDVHQLSQAEAQPVLHSICQSAPLVPWDVDVHEHYETLSSHLRDRLSSLFPVRRARCRRTYFSSTTWELRQQRLWLRKRLHTAIGCILGFERYCALFVWRWHLSIGRVLLHSLADVLRVVSEVRSHIAELRSIKPALRRAIINDRTCHLRELANAAQNMPTKDVVTRLRPLLGPPKRKQRQHVALPALKLEDGTLAADNESATHRWIQHFCELEDGRPVSPGELVQQCRLRQNSKDIDDVALDFRRVPSRVFFEESIRRAPTGRACGNDGIPADLLHLQANTLSLPLFQVALKASFRLAEPIQWKGGALHAIWKRKGPVDACDSYRGILVSSAAGKAFHSSIRRKAAPFLDVAAGTFQIGGRAGQPVQIANQSVRIFQAECASAGVSCAIVFLDLKEAFHRVVRPLIVGGPLDDRHVSGVLQALNLPPDAYDRLQNYVRDTPIFADAGADVWTTGILSEVLADTWFTWGHDGGLATVRGGTRPGDNLADMLFSFLFAEVLQRIRSQLQALGHIFQYPWHSDWSCSLERVSAADTQLQGPSDVTWIDDLALLFRSRTAIGLIHGVQQIATVLLDECVRAVLMPNLGRGKTEAVITLVGPGSRKAKLEHCGGTEPTLALQSTLWPTARLRVVAAYKHLGGIIHHTCSTSPEVRSRIGSAWAAFRKHQKKVFTSRCAGAREKAILFESLVLSTLSFGIGHMASS